MCRRNIYGTDLFYRYPGERGLHFDRLFLSAEMTGCTLLGKPVISFAFPLDTIVLSRYNSNKEKVGRQQDDRKDHTAEKGAEKV